MRLLLLLFSAATVGTGAASPVASADRAWSEFEQIRETSVPADATKEEKNTWWKAKVEDLRRLGAAFLAEHPEDPRRWTVAVHLRENLPWPDPQSPLSAFDALLRDLTAAAVERQDLPNEIRGRASLLTIEDAMVRAGVADSREQWIAIQGLLDAHQQRFGADPWLKLTQVRCLERLDAVAPEVAQAVVDRLAESPHAELRSVAQVRRFLGQLRSDPLELRFTALAGRVVDFQELRGKVVLLYFWATWCQPCVVELPALLDLHRRHVSSGFEIVGVSLDRLGARDKLMAFVRERGVPWPQHFDPVPNGRNSLAERFGINAIPAKFLFDRSGRLVTAVRHSDGLEAEVERQLQR